MSFYLQDLRRRVGHGLLLLPVVAAVVVTDEGQVLMQRRSDNREWGIPGGAIEPGEPPARTVVRETFEETGILVRPQELLGVYGGDRTRFVYPNGDQVEPTIVVFRCRPIGGNLAMTDGESIELAFCDPASVLTVAGFKGMSLSELMQASFEWNEAWLSMIASDKT